MYHKIKTITIFSTNFDTQNSLKQISETKKHKNYNIKSLSNYNENYHNSDIIICDLPVLCLLNYHNQMKENTYLIYISNYKDDLCNDYYEVADEVLIRPIQLEYLNKRIHQIYQNMKQDEELWLNNTYLNVLIDSMPDLVWFKDINGIHKKVNDVFCQTVGKKKLKEKIIVQYGMFRLMIVQKLKILLKKKKRHVNLMNSLKAEVVYVN